MNKYDYEEGELEMIQAQKERIARIRAAGRGGNYRSNSSLISRLLKFWKIITFQS